MPDVGPAGFKREALYKIRRVLTSLSAGTPTILLYTAMYQQTA
jgi:hypothetical protein